MLIFITGASHLFIYLFFSQGFSIEHVESVLNKVELEAKEPKKNFGLLLSTVRPC